MTYITTLRFVIHVRETRKNFKYGQLIAEKAEAIQWDRLSIDLIGPYKIRREGHEYPLIIKL